MELKQRLTFVFSLVLLLHVRCIAQKNKTEFFLVFMEHHFNLLDENIQLRVFVSNPTSNMVQVGIVYKGLPNEEQDYRNIASGETLTLSVDNEMILQESIKHNKSVVITAVDDVIVQAESNANAAPRTSSSFQVLPRSALSANYIVATFCSPLTKCVFAVTSVEDGNHVTVNFRIEKDMKAKYGGSSYKDGDTLSDSLQKGETMQIVCMSCDMTGTWISSSKCVAVFGGGQMAKTTAFEMDGPRQRDRVAEQMMPVEALGRHYVLEKNPPGVVDFVKVVALKAGTRFSFNKDLYNCTRDREVFPCLRNSSELSEIVSHGGRLLVFQLLFDADAIELVMNLPVPVTLWSTSYRVFVPTTEPEKWLFLVLPSGTQPTVSSLSVKNNGLSFTSESNNYTSVVLKLSTDGGIVDIRCPDDATACQPFYGFVVYNVIKRDTASVTLLDTDRVIAAVEKATRGATADNVSTATQTTVTPPATHYTSPSSEHVHTTSSSSAAAENHAVSTPTSSGEGGGSDVTLVSTETPLTHSASAGDPTGIDVTTVVAGTSSSSDAANGNAGHDPQTDVTTVVAGTSSSSDAANGNAGHSPQTDVTTVVAGTSSSSDAANGNAGHGPQTDVTTVVAGTSSSSDAAKGNAGHSPQTDVTTVVARTSSSSDAANGNAGHDPQTDVTTVVAGTSSSSDTANGNAGHGPQTDVTTVVAGTSSLSDAANGNAGHDPQTDVTTVVAGTSSSSDTANGNAGHGPQTDVTTVAAETSSSSDAANGNAGHDPQNDVTTVAAETSSSSDAADGNAGHSPQTDAATTSKVTSRSENSSSPAIKPGDTSTATPDPKRWHCLCRCARSAPTSFLSNETRERFMREKSVAIVKELSVQRNTLSAYVRSKSSAHDRRTSSTVSGLWMCLVAFGILVGFIAGADLLGLVKCLLDYGSNRGKRRRGDNEQ